MSFWPSCFKVLDRRPPWEWGAEKVRIKNSPYAGNRFRPELTPWLKEPLSVLPFNTVTEITCQCCVQGSKTVYVLVGSSWAIEFQPDTMMITCQSDDDAKFYAKERANYALERIPSIAARMPTDRSKKSMCSISLSDMSLEIQGANPNNLNSKPVRWIFNDEVWLWKRGLLDEARKRGTRYWNRRIVNVSTAGEKGCDMDLAFEAGDKREWHLKCPTCGKLNFPKWERIKWAKKPDDFGWIAKVPTDRGIKEKPVKLENGDWDFEAIKYATYFECEHCNAPHMHTHDVHTTMNDGGAYIATNPNPTPGHVSFHWNALCLAPSELSWGDLAVEWLKAEIEFGKGNEAPRKEFIQKRLAESYDPNKYVSTVALPTERIDGDWPIETVRFLTVDVQETEFYVLVIAFSDSGDDFVMDARKLFSWDEIRAYQQSFRIHDRCVGVDCGFDTRKVYEMCARYGWTALRGEDRKEFTYSKRGKTYLLPYSWPPAKGDPLMGTQMEGRSPACSVVRWSNPTIKDIAKKRRDGHTRTKTIFSDTLPPEFHQHMFSEIPRREFDKRGNESIRWGRIGKRPNHWWDCYCEGMTMGCMAKKIGDRPEDNESTP